MSSDARKALGSPEIAMRKDAESGFLDVYVDKVSFDVKRKMSIAQ